MLLHQYSDLAGILRQLINIGRLFQACPGCCGQAPAAVAELLKLMLVCFWEVQGSACDRCAYKLKSLGHWLCSKFWQSAIVSCKVQGLSTEHLLCIVFPLHMLPFLCLSYVAGNMCQAIWGMSLVYRTHGLRRSVC